MFTLQELFAGPGTFWGTYFLYLCFQFQGHRSILQKCPWLGCSTLWRSRNYRARACICWMLLISHVPHSILHTCHFSKSALVKSNWPLCFWYIGRLICLIFLVLWACCKNANHNSFKDFNPRKGSWTLVLGNFLVETGLKFLCITYTDTMNHITCFIFLSFSNLTFMGLFEGVV